MTKQQAERGEYLAELKKILQAGDTVYSILKHVSRSGMLRSIDFYVYKDNKPVWLSYKIAKALGYTFNKQRECINVSGAGMDMGYSVVYNLSAALWPNGHTCLGDWDENNVCPSNDHSNGMELAHDVLEASGIQHHDGGYCLRHKWQ